MKLSIASGGIATAKAQCTPVDVRWYGAEHCEVREELNIG